MPSDIGPRPPLGPQEASKLPKRAQEVPTKPSGGPQETPETLFTDPRDLRKVCGLRPRRGDGMGRR
eukprot:5453770-Pyramimonas_sp.AAC.1